jgi:hypothetical protein
MGRAWRCRIAIADKLDLVGYSFKVVLGSFGCRSGEECIRIARARIWFSESTVRKHTTIHFHLEKSCVMDTYKLTHIVLLTKYMKVP